MSNGIRYVGGGLPKFQQDIKEAGSNLKEEIFDNIRELAKMGAQRTKVRVETAGTDTNPQGRVETGRMRDAIKHEADVDTSGDRITARFGWLDNQPRYTIFQEEGTRGGQGNGRGIEAMNALFEGYMEVKSHLDGGRIVR